MVQIGAAAPESVLENGLRMLLCDAMELRCCDCYGKQELPTCADQGPSWGAIVLQFLISVMGCPGLTCEHCGLLVVRH